MLTAENYSKGFLIDEELMGGVAPHPTSSELFLGYVLRHTTGEYLGYQDYPSLDAALEALNRIPRSWQYEKSSGCGSCLDGNCGKNFGGGCHKKSSAPEAETSDACCDPASVPSVNPA